MRTFNIQIFGGEKFSLVVLFLLPVVVDQVFRWFLHIFYFTLFADSVNEVVMDFFIVKSTEQRREYTRLSHGKCTTSFSLHRCFA